MEIVIVLYIIKIKNVIVIVRGVSIVIVERNDVIVSVNNLYWIMRRMVKLDNIDFIIKVINMVIGIKFDNINELYKFYC